MTQDSRQSGVREGEPWRDDEERRTWVDARLMWEIHCAIEDGVSVPFERWMMEDGPAALVQECRDLREAFDAVSENRDDIANEARKLIVTGLSGTVTREDFDPLRYPHLALYVCAHDA